MFYLIAETVVARWCFTDRVQLINSDKHTDIKAQKPNPMTIEISKPRMSTNIASFGPRRRSAFDRLPKEGGLSLRSEGAVDSTTPITQSSGSQKPELPAPLQSFCLPSDIPIDIRLYDSTTDKGTTSSPEAYPTAIS
jgi:hypothetical protein